LLCVGSGRVGQLVPAYPRITDAYTARMQAHGLNPILNVSDLTASIRWFESLGWEKAWDWGDPPSFGAVRSGACEVFLCQDGQGGRGHGGVVQAL
jgi:hypothetical protein